MESLLSLTAETLLDPFVIVPALLVVAALVSGLVARIVDAVEGVRRRPTELRHSAGSARAGGFSMPAHR